MYYMKDYVIFMWIDTYIDIYIYVYIGPHHLFIGVSKDTLELMSKVAKESVNNNLTIIVNSVDEIEKFGPIQV
jgi:hypothetical protein